jgi:uncharacterized protein Yka (UPF0111/DUF47 family)
MDFIDILTPLFSSLDPAQISKQVILFLAAWQVVKKSIKTHFTNIENGIKSVAENVNKLTESLKQLETNHSVRISALESEVGGIKSILTKRGKNG